MWHSAVAFEEYVLAGDKTVHLALLNRGGRVLAHQSATLRGTTARVFGTMRASKWHFFWLWLRTGGRMTTLRRAYLGRFEALCRREGATRLVGAVPPRIWTSSYRRWTGFRDTGERIVSSLGRPLWVVEKKL